MACPSYPETNEEWWELVDENWAELLTIMNKFLALEGKVGLEGEVLGHSLAAEVTRIKENRDSRLADYFQATWFAAPDKYWIRKIPKWFLLCDLCSEDYVLCEEHNDT